MTSRIESTAAMTLGKATGTVKSWFGSLCSRKAARKAARRVAALTALSRKAVQVREFKGEVFVCFEGVPILPADGLKWDIATTLDVARETYVKFHEQEKEAGHGR